LGGESKRKNHEGMKNIFPTKSQRKDLEITPRKSPREGSKSHQKEQTGKTHPSFKEPHRIIYAYQRGSYKV
jgi:hypothetical protein